MVRTLSIALGWLALPLMIAAPLAAQDTEEEESRGIYDGIYTEDQATRGEETFMAICLECHDPGEFIFNGLYEFYDGQTMKDLWDYVTTEMPESNPGGLSPEEYSDVMAYMFKMDGLPAGEGEFPSNTAELRKIIIGPPAGSN